MFCIYSTNFKQQLYISLDIGAFVLRMFTPISESEISFYFNVQLESSKIYHAHMKEVLLYFHNFDWLLHAILVHAIS